MLNRTRSLERFQASVESISLRFGTAAGPLVRGLDEARRHAGDPTALTASLANAQTVLEALHVELQRLDAPTPFLVTLNRSDAIDPARIIKRITYHHPLYTPASVAAQARQREINGALGIYYCGAWWRNGFHEDGVVSALHALAHFEDDHAQRTLYRSA